MSNTKTARQSQGLNQFYAEFFYDLASGIVAHPDKLYVEVETLSGSLAQAAGLAPRISDYEETKARLLEEKLPTNGEASNRFRVRVTPNINDYPALLGKKAAHIKAFQLLLREAAAKRGEFCDVVLIEEENDHRRASKPVPLSAVWKRDKEVEDLVFRAADDCFNDVIDARARSSGGVTTVTVSSEGGIAEEAFAAMQTLMKAYGRTQGRNIVLEQRKI